MVVAVEGVKKGLPVAPERASIGIESMRAACVLAFAACHVPVAGDVVEATDSGFVSAFEVEIGATPERTFDALWNDVAKWWDPAHTYSGDAENMVFADLFGLFEELPSLAPSASVSSASERKPPPFGSSIDPFVRHMEIDMVRPPSALRLRGGMGPLQTLAVAGSMTFDLEATDDGTRLRYRYVVNGPRLGDYAEPVDRVMGGQLQRLRRYVETGEPAPEEEP